MKVEVILHHPPGHGRGHDTLRDLQCTGSVGSQEQNLGHLQDISHQGGRTGGGHGVVR